MHTAQLDFVAGGANKISNLKPNLVLVFAEKSKIADLNLYNELKVRYPVAHIVGCSTAGEILDTQVLDNSVSVTEIEFAKTEIQTRSTLINEHPSSYDAGYFLANQLDHKNLKHAIIVSEGLKVNGSKLVAGLTQGLPKDIGLTGGLSGDGPNFKSTLVMCDGPAQEGQIVIIGFYGDNLEVGYGSVSGWDSFGTERLITRSKDNILYDIDGKSALQLYKQYLGDYAHQLPSSGLLFPLALRSPEGNNPVIRTILAVDEEHQSMIFAGDVPEGNYARLMKANFNRLIQGAEDAAKTSSQAVNSHQPDLALLVSCVGRKMVLKQRIEEEIEVVRGVLGSDATLCGFYSYGEVSPFTAKAECQLHNQTMTITTFREH